MSRRSSMALAVASIALSTMSLVLTLTTIACAADADRRYVLSVTDASGVASHSRDAFTQEACRSRLVDEMKRAVDVATEAHRNPDLGMSSEGPARDRITYTLRIGGGSRDLIWECRPAE